VRLWGRIWSSGSQLVRLKIRATYPLSSSTDSWGLEPLMDFAELASCLGLPVSTVYDWRVPSVPSVPVGALCCGDPGDSPDPRNGMCTRARSASVDSHKLFGASCRPMVGNLGDRE